MTHHRIDCELAVLAVLCILTIFLFPVMQGPYSAVHGPVTALQSVRSGAKLRVVIMQAALKTFGKSLISLLGVLWLGALSDSEFRPPRWADCDTILRC